MLGSAAKAKAFLGDMKRFAATTPFEFPDVDRASKKFLAFGWNVDAVLPALTAVGDAASALGLGGEGIDRITLALGQMSIKAKASGEEIRQLNEAGISAQRYLTEAFNLSADAFDNLAKTGITGVQATQAIIEGMLNDKRLEGMMQKQSDTLVGMWSTVKDNARQIFGKVGESTTGWVTDSLRVVRDWTSQFTEHIRNGASVTDTIMKALPEEWGRRFERFAGILGRLYMAFEPARGALMDGLQLVANVAGKTWDILYPVFDLATDLFATVVEYIGWAVGEIVKAATWMVEQVEKAWNALPRIWDKVMSGMQKTALRIAGNRGIDLTYDVPGDGLDAPSAGDGDASDLDVTPKPEAKPRPTRPTFKLDLPSLGSPSTESAEKAAAKVAEINDDLLDKIKELALGEYEYQRWALDREIAALETAGASKERVREYYAAQSAEIAQSEAQAQKDALEEEVKAAERAAQDLAATQFDLQEQLQRALADTGQITEREYQLWRIDEWVQAQLLEWPQLATEIRKTADALRDVVNIQYPAPEDFLGGLASGAKKAYAAMTDWGSQAAGMAQRAAEAMSSSFSDLFFDVMTGEFESLADYAKSFFDAIAREIANMLANLWTAKIMGAMFPGLFADGGVFQAGNVTPFALGGVNPGIPQLFPMANGGTGVWGEAGPEAIMPLTRLPDGKLGVEAQGGGGSQTVVNVYNNTGSQAEVRQESHFDGQRWVVDVWLDALANNVGGLRGVVQGGVR